MLKPETTLAACIHAALLFALPSSYAADFDTPSRTIYKCVAKGVTTYSDVPCLGATRIDVVPTRGADRLSGSTRIGQDVSRERWHEGLVKALQPITGMDTKQYATFGRRYQLPNAAQQECQQLDQSIPRTEDDERHAVQPALRDVQLQLYQLRRRFHELRC